MNKFKPDLDYNVIMLCMHIRLEQREHVCGVACSSSAIVQLLSKQKLILLHFHLLFVQ